MIFFYKLTQVIYSAVRVENYGVGRSLNFSKELGQNLDFQLACSSQSTMRSFQVLIHYLFSQVILLFFSSL